MLFSCLCGSAACAEALPVAERRGHLAGEIDILFCGPACELAAQRLANRLGNANVAMDRFAAALHPPKARLQAQPAEVPHAYAAGAADNPIMLARIKVRSVCLQWLLSDVRVIVMLSFIRLACLLSKPTLMG